MQQLPVVDRLPDAPVGVGIDQTVGGLKVRLFMLLGNGVVACHIDGAIAEKIGADLAERGRQVRTGLVIAKTGPE